LTGWRIDIHSESKVRGMEEQTRRQLTSLEGVGEAMADTLFKLGWRSIDDLATSSPAELAKAAEVGGEEGAARVIEAARRLSAQVHAQAEAERERLAREAKKTEAERLAGVQGATPESIERLAAAGYRSVEQIHKDDDIKALARALGFGLTRALLFKFHVKSYLGLTGWGEAPPAVDEDEEPVAPLPVAETAAADAAPAAGPGSAGGSP
jgi:N utilization substance protein A